MEDQSKYSKRAKYKGKTELFRVYYRPSEISLEIFLWIEQKAVIDAIADGLTVFKAFSSPSLGPIMICKN